MFEREASHVSETRAALGEFLEAYYKLRQLRDKFDALGGQSAFNDYLNQTPTPPTAITGAEFYSAIVSVNNIETAMNLGPKVDFFKVAG